MKSSHNEGEAAGGVPALAIREQLERILLSEGFAHSDRLRRFLRFTTERVIDDHTGDLKEYLLGVEVFDRAASYDPRMDPIVRVEAVRLRAKLRAYYQAEGEQDPVWIDLPKGGYIPVIRLRKAPEPARGAPSEFNTIAVNPIADFSERKDCEYLCSGLGEEITTALLQVDGLRVIGPRADGSPGAGLLLQGSLRKSGTRVRIAVRLMNPSTRDYIWSATYDRVLDDPFAMQDEIAQAIAAELRGRLAAGLYGSGGETQAYNAYLIGRYHWNKRSEDGLKKSIRYFEEAIAKNPSFALAHAALADAYCLLGNYGALAAPGSGAESEKRGGAVGEARRCPA